ncbi:MAG: beta-mannanase [Lentisphaeria bacterium]|nr:beta-mannanase [Lentisphaeria bacterium]
MEFGKQNFYTGCNYWASHAGTGMWHDWRPDVVEDDFRKLASLKLKVVRLFPLWPDFQPLKRLARGANESCELRWKNDEVIPRDEDGVQSGVDPEMLERFRFVCDCAGKNNIKLGIGLVTGWMSGRMFAPPAFEQNDLLRDPVVIRWQLKLVRRLVKEFRNHPAIAFWGIGNECNCLGPAQRFSGALWAETISEAIRREDPSRPVVAGMHGLKPMPVSALTDSDQWCIQDMGEIFDVLTVHPYPSFTPYMSIDRISGIKNAFHATAEAHLYGDIAKRPCVAEELGTLAPSWGNEKTAGNYLRNTLLNLWAHDCEGLYWWCGFDQLNLSHPPYQWCGVERELGLFRNDGSCKPVGEVMRKFSEMQEALPFDRLPRFATDAVCILNSDHEAWPVALGTWVLAKQAGLDLEFQFSDEPLRDCGVYIVPAVCGLNNMPKDRFTELFDKVENGATLYFSYDGAAIAEFENLFGMTVEYFEEFSGTVNVAVAGKELPFCFNSRLTLTPAGAEVLLHDADGRPVLSQYRCGKGKVFFMALPVEQHIVRNNRSAEEPYCEIYRIWAKEVLAARPLRSRTHNVTVTIHPVDEKNAYVTAVNNNDAPAALAAELNSGWQIAETLWGDLDVIGGHDCTILKIRRQQ